MTSDTFQQADGDRLREACGVFGIFQNPDAAALTALGLHALQHRGQEAAGIVSFDGRRYHSERRMGLVGDHFTQRSVIERLAGEAAIGHNRYSTTGDTIMRNVQPLFADLDAGGFALGHNGNLTNALTLRKELIKEGAIFQSTTDTEVILHLVARSTKGQFTEKFIEALLQIEGGYALVGLTNKKLIGARDPLGIRPLVLGRLGDSRLAVESSHAWPIGRLDDGAEGMPEEIDALAASGREGAGAQSHAVTVLVWRHADDQYATAARDTDVTLRIERLPFAGNVRVRHWRIDAGHSNSHAAWRALGSPQDPTAEQLQAIHARQALEPFEADRIVAARDGAVTLRVALPLPGVSLLALGPAER